MNITQQNRLITSEWYEAVGMNDSYGLAVGNWPTIDELKAQIDHSEKRAKEKGYAGQRWLIVHEWVNKIFVRNSDADSERFMYENRTRHAVAIYDDGKIYMLDESK